MLDLLDPKPAKPLHGLRASPEPPPGAAADWTVPQNWDAFTPEDHRVWDLLFERQQRLLRGRAVRAFGDGLDILRLDEPGVPRLEALNARLHARTGWTVVAVPGLVPDDVFFRHLAERRFPTGNFIRGADQLDYLEEPDVFHDVFGHVPLLAHPPVAAFMAKLGALGLRAREAGVLHRVSRLYWYTVEFGLAREDGGLRAYGAGLLSSGGEARFSLEDPAPRRLRFTLPRVLRTGYRSDAFQESYFVIDQFQDLLEIARDEDGLLNLCRALDGMPDVDPRTAEPYELAP